MTTIAGVVCTIGEPFRQEWYTNRWLLFALFLQAIWLLYQLFAGAGDFPENDLNLEPVPMYFSFIELGLIGGNVVTAGLLWMFAGRYDDSINRFCVYETIHDITPYHKEKHPFNTLL